MYLFIIPPSYSSSAVQNRGAIRGYCLPLVSGFFLVAKAADVLWGLLLSCFVHARAKHNSEALFDLNCVSPFCLGLSPYCLYLLPIVVDCLFYYGMQWLVFGLLRVGLEARYA